MALAAGERWAPLRVTGILGADGPAQALDGNFALMDIAAAQWAVDSLGRLDRVDVRLADGVDVAMAERDITARLPPGLTVRRPSARGAEVERMLRAFHFNLTALSLIALLVGLFLVYNTVSVSVIARRAEIGTLRTLGASRAAVAALFLGEAAALSVVGSAIGAPLGWGMAHGAVGLTSSTVSQFWIASAAVVAPLDAGMVATAFAVGVPLALAAAAVPALEAARVAPLAAVRGDRDLAVRARLPRRFVAGPLLLFAAGALLALPGPVGGLPVFGMLAALAVVLGAATAMPAVLVAFRGAAGATLARWGRVEGRLAHANLGAAIPRLSISVAALAASLAMMVAIAIMVGSFRETVVYWVGQTLQADLFLAASRRGPTDARAAISDGTEAVIAAHPAVAAIDGFASVEARYGGSVISIGAGRFDVVTAHGGLQFKAPADGGEAMRRAVGRDAVVVTEAFSLRHGAGPGDRIDLPTPHGPTSFDVMAVYYDYSSDRGGVVMDEATFARHFGPRRPAGLSVYLVPGADAETVRDELRAALGPERRLFINTNASLRASGAAHLRRDVRHHLRARGDRRRGVDVRHRGDAPRAGPGAAPRDRNAPPRRRREPPSAAHDRDRGGGARRRGAGGGPGRRPRAVGNPHLRNQCPELRMDDSVPPAGRFPGAGDGGGRGRSRAGGALPGPAGGALRLRRAVRRAMNAPLTCPSMG